MTSDRPAGSRSSSAGPYVWYASYGSNLLKARFDCYLQGTQLAGQRYGCKGARNPTDPVAVDSIDVPHRLFFARTSPRWGGGLAFLEPKPRPGATARLRLYKITLEQFNDVLAQENRLPIPLPVSLRVTTDRLQSLTQGSGVSLLDSPYGYLKCMGNRDGCKILTFTCSPENLRYAEAGAPPWHFNLPAEAYFNVIKSGLTESGMSDRAAQAYLLDSLASSPGVTRGVASRSTASYQLPPRNHI